MGDASGGGIRADIVEEGERLLELASGDGVPLRLLGGVAIRLRAPGELPPALQRSYADLDFVTAKKGSGAQELFRRAGYEPDVSFNALNGRERLLFYDTAHERQVDVFVGKFSMSHTIPVAGRLEVDPVSIPLAELLLTKLQIAELNEKDVRDGVAIVYCHDLGEEDGDTISARRIAELCAGDWGLWRTITANLATCADLVDDYDLPEADKSRVRAAANEIRRRIDVEPKSRAWKLRAKIGERKRWYEVPEEVQR
ncbi:MAG: hypothetical protein M3R70_08705 [Actinomycetota bacterium]|nr:hypothetical protein [Actinomycetota bacterium]